MAVRYYCIADGPQEIIRTPNVLEFLSAIIAHTQGMEVSKKENNFAFYTADMEDKDFEIAKKNKALSNRRGLKLV